MEDRRKPALAENHLPRWEEAAFAPLSDTGAALGESPVWSPEDQAVWWVDISGSRLLRTSLDGQTTATTTPEHPGFVQVVDGVIFVGMQCGIFRFDRSTATFDRVAAIPSTTQRFNDSCIDARGRIWAGTMDMDNARADGVLYLFDPGDLSLRTMATGFRTINGLAWDGPRARLFVSDSHPSIGAVWTRGVAADDTLGDPTLFADFSRFDGRPDGAALAGNGDYWIAGVGGSSLYRFALDGTLTRRFRVPASSPTKVAILPGPKPAMVLTSIGGQDDNTGGRLALWSALPNDLFQERQQP